MLDELHARHLDTLHSLDAVVTGQGLRLGAQYVMFFAEAELMRQHAHHLTQGFTQPDVLEIGLGLGVFAEQLAAFDIGSYTAVEPHPGVAAIAYNRVLQSFPVPAKVLGKPWQLTDFPPSTFDAIMYDTWPPEGMADQDFATFVESVAIPSLRPGGRFSFFCSGSFLPERRLQVLKAHFAQIKASRYSLPANEAPPSWTKPTLDFVVPVAVKRG